jgi:type II secretion system protein N
MEKILGGIKFIFQNKSKIFLMLFSTFVFSFLLFPFDDLSDLVTAQVSKLTSNQVYLQFDKMHLGVIPSVGLHLKNVSVETPQISALTAQEFSVSPSLSTLIHQKPAGTISATGILKGNVEISLKSAGKTESGTDRQGIQLNAENISLAELKDLLSLPVYLKGKLDISSQAVIDLAFKEQPDMDLNVNIDKFELPPGNVQTMMGPLALPEIKLAQVQLKGRLSAGKFNIEEGKIGKPTDDLHGDIKGSLQLQLRNTSLGIQPEMGEYNLQLNLNVKKDLQERAALFLSFIDQYKTATPEGARYAFRISAPNVQMPPTLAAPR